LDGGLMKARRTKVEGWRVMLGVACALSLAACTQKAAVEHPPQPGDRAVARVNGATVWASDVKREAVAQGLIGQGEPLDIASDAFRQVLDQVIDSKLLASEAIRRGLDRDATAGRRLSAARDRVLGDMLLEASLGRTVNDDAVNGLYQEMLRNETPSVELRLRQVVLGTQAEAQQVKQLLGQGASFDAVAAERSKDAATRFRGGELDPLTVDMLPAAYAGPMKDAKAGQLVGPFKTDAGWVVARIDERRAEAPITLEIARPQIIRFLTYDQVKDLILNLRHHAKVTTLIPPPASGGASREPASAPTPVPAGTAKP
jgi:peptidyl-prolyl cis-trans isomerase C